MEQHPAPDASNQPISEQEWHSLSILEQKRKIEDATGQICPWTDEELLAREKQGGELRIAGLQPGNDVDPRTVFLLVSKQVDERARGGHVDVDGLRASFSDALRVDDLELSSVAKKGVSYDAVSMLGFGDAGQEPLPEAAEGEIVLRYGGWSLDELQESAIGQQLMEDQSWYYMCPWSSEKLPAGIYRLRLPVAESNFKSAGEQEAMLPEGEQIAPVVLVASALLAQRLQADGDLLNDEWIRCREKNTIGDRVALCWNKGRLYIDGNWDDVRYDGVWSSSVRTS